MAEESSMIETGVDKLVGLVRKNKKISVAEAAKQLGVSTVVVEEWADFLEEEGILSVEYKFTTPYLVERLLTKDEVEKKEKEFGGKKEAFVRKAEVTLALMDKEGESFQRIREQFDELKKGLAEEVKKVKGDLGELEKYEELKNKIGLEIEEQQKQFKERIGQVESQISRDEKKYAEILDKISEEDKKIDKEKMMALSIRERENLLRERLEEFRKMIDKLEGSIEAEDQQVVDSEGHIQGLKDVASEVRESVEQKKRVLDELLEESREQEKRVMALHDSILAKAQAKKQEIEKRIEESKGASRKFREFFDKKAKIEDTIKSVSEQRNELERELIQLIQKAKAFSIATRTEKGVAPQLVELKKTFSTLERKRGIFENEIRKLISLIGK